MAFKLIIPAFHEGAAIPTLHTCDGADLSPSIEWSGGPKETKSFLLIMDDPDAPAGTWTHWLLYDIPPSTHGLPQGYKAGPIGASGTNDFGRPGYGGPCPPKGNGPHRYFFKLYAINVASLGLHAGARREDVDHALHGKALGEAQHMGRYERK